MERPCRHAGLSALCSVLKARHQTEGPHSSSTQGSVYAGGPRNCGPTVMGSVCRPWGVIAVALFILTAPSEITTNRRDVPHSITLPPATRFGASRTVANHR